MKSIFMSAFNKFRAKNLQLESPWYVLAPFHIVGKYQDGDDGQARIVLQSSARSKV